MLRKLFRESYQTLEGPGLGESTKEEIGLISVPLRGRRTGTYFEGGDLKLGKSVGGQRL